MAKGKRKRLLEKRQNVAETMEIDSALPESQKTTTEAMDVDVLKPKSGAGVQKQRQKKKPLRRNQRLRHEKGLKRAEAVNDQLAKKVGESETRGRTIKSRRHDWEDVNATISAMNTGDAKKQKQVNASKPVFSPEKVAT